MGGRGEEGQLPTCLTRLNQATRQELTALCDLKLSNPHEETCTPKQIDRLSESLPGTSWSYFAIDVVLKELRHTLHPDWKRQEASKKPSRQL